MDPMSNVVFFSPIVVVKNLATTALKIEQQLVGFLRVPGCSRGGGNWGTLRVPFGKIGVHRTGKMIGESPPGTRNRILKGNCCWTFLPLVC